MDDITVAMHPYRKRPVVIKAVQVPSTKEAFQPIIDYANSKEYGVGKERTIEILGHITSGMTSGIRGHVHTLEGDMDFVTGDWIIQGVVGELYPCRDDIFQQTYEPA